MRGGYRVPYDPRPALRALRDGNDPEAVWSEFWDELHHQGDVDEASYAVVPYLVEWLNTTDAIDWDPFALLAVIEIERHRKRNPPIPDYLVEGYQSAWSNLGQLALRKFAAATDRNTQRVLLGILALSKGLIGHGALLVNFDEAEIEDLLNKTLDWTTAYRH
jgi:hypothetical protein